jgi:hypothetical protein
MGMRQTKYGDGRLPRARRRDWTLATLNRDQTYWLFFDPLSSRWSIALVNEDDLEDRPPPAPPTRS